MNNIVYNIEQIINESEECLSNKKYLASLVLALILPDICSKVENNSSDSKHEYYVKWCNKWVCAYFPSILPNWTNNYKERFGEVIYLLRCSLMHNGENDTSKFDSPIFKLLNFNLYIDEQGYIEENAGCIRVFAKSGYEGNQNDYYVSINLGMLVKALLNGTNDFIHFNKLDNDDFPKFNISIENSK